MRIDYDRTTYAGNKKVLKNHPLTSFECPHGLQAIVLRLAELILALALACSFLLQTPIAAAVYGIENNFGHLVASLSACFNWAEEQFLRQLPDVCFQVVKNRNAESRLIHTGVDAGKFAPGSRNSLRTGIA